MMKTLSTRQEKEKLVVELYNQGKTYAQIAKEAHVSLRDIGPILSKAGIQQNQSLLSRALELYHQQKTPVEVAIILGLEADEAIRLHRQYYTLLGCTEFARIYPEIKDDPWSYVNLVNLTKNQQMNTKHVGNLLKIANNDLPSVENRLQELERKESILISNHQQATRNLNELNDQISKENEEIEQLRSNSNQLKDEVKKLKNEKLKLENAISSIKINDETSIIIKQIVRREIESLQSNPRKLLRCALASIFQSETNHPGKLMALYYNNSPSLSVERILSISQIEQYPGQYRFDGENLEKLLLDEAEQVLTRIVESLANKCLNEITNDTPPGPSVNDSSNIFTNDTELPSQQVPTPNILPDPSLHEGHDPSPNASMDGISIRAATISAAADNWLFRFIVIGTSGISRQYRRFQYVIFLHHHNQQFLKSSFSRSLTRPFFKSSFASARRFLESLIFLFQLLFSIRFIFTRETSCTCLNETLVQL
jgi:hypothetical protein